MAADLLRRTACEMIRPCSGRGPAPSAVARSEPCLTQRDCAAGAEPKHGGCSWLAGGRSIKWRASPIQGASRTMPGRRNRSHGARAVAAGRLQSFAQRPFAPSRNCSRRRRRRPRYRRASRRRRASTSLMRPAVAPETSAASVGTSARSESSVAMMTLSIPYHRIARQRLIDSSRQDYGVRPAVSNR